MDRTAKVWFRHRQFARILAIATTFLILVTGTPSATGQQSPQLPLELPPLDRLVNRTSTSSALAIGDVWLDGNRLFSVAVPAIQSQSSESKNISPIQERVRTIEATLRQIASSPVDPNQIAVIVELEPRSSLPILVLQDGAAATGANRYIMTVTNLDAQLQAEGPQQRAEQLAKILENALKQARWERQPNVLAQRFWQAAQILLAIVLASWLLSQVQRYLKTRQRHLSNQFAPPLEQALPNTLTPDDTAAIEAVQAQMIRRQQFTLNEVQRRFLQLLQVGIWGGGSFMILGLFPYTRWLQPLVLSAPLQLLAIVLGVYVAIRISDVLIDRFFSLLTVQEAIPPSNSQRLALRVSTFSRVLRSIVGFLLLSTGVLSVLSVLGVELGPVLAGAGILGLAISFAYDVDIDHAIGLIKQVGKAMNQDSLWDGRILEEPEVLGVEDLNNAGIIIRIWIKTQPLEQWNVAREFRRRLKLALDEAGIAIGVPQQSLWFRSSPGENYPALQRDVQPPE
jgi:small conductance mechanosensitive channel